MKPFNLEKALAGEPVVTRDGKPVSEIVLLKTVAFSRRVLFVVNGEVYSTNETGKFYADSAESGRDLFMVPKIVKKSGWLNVYPKNKVGYGIYETKQIADINSEDTRVACIFVEWEEEE